MINFKKIVSMVVMLSLMLGACGKNPARRDGEMTDEKADALTQETGEESGSTGKRIVVGASGEALGAGLGMAVTLIIANVVLPCFDKSHSFSLGDIALFSGLCLCLGIVPGGISEGIFEWMSEAAGDEWWEVLLKTGLTGFGMGVAAGIGFTVMISKK